LPGGGRSTQVSEPLPPFQRFLDSHRDAVWRLLLSTVGAVDAEDCFQETFIAALRAYPSVAPDSNLRAWVLTIAHHKALDCHRARARRAVSVAEPEFLDSRSDPSPGLRDQALWNAVAELPERQRSAVVLRFVADLAHREVAAAIGCSEEAARRSLHEGLRTLRQVVVA